MKKIWVVDNRTAIETQGEYPCCYWGPEPGVSFRDLSDITKILFEGDPADYAGDTLHDIRVEKCDYCMRQVPNKWYPYYGVAICERCESGLEYFKKVDDEEDG